MGRANSNPAENRSKETQRTFEYRQCPWGDLVYGTKEELQFIGIGKGMAFPGELDGPKRLLNVRDPRGFATEVTHFSEDTYCASISFPGRERTPDQQTTIAPGVRKYSSVCRDKYVGTAEALAAVGLARMDQLPGQPGMRKTRVTIFPDGTMPTGAPTTNYAQAHMPGSKFIERASKTTYEVSVVVSQEERDRRWEASRRSDLEYEARMRALPRPAPLVAPTAAGSWPHSRSGLDPNLAKFTSVDDCRRKLQSIALMVAPVNALEMIKQFDDMKSIDGYVYGVIAESREAIEDALNELQLALRDIQVYRRKYDNRSEEEKAVARGLLANAESDKAFQRFISQLPVGRQ